MAKPIEEWFIYPKCVSLYINITDGINKTEISKKVHIVYNHTCNLVDSFEKDGLVKEVKYEISKFDGRKHGQRDSKIFLTEKGRKFQKMMTSLLKQFRR